MNDEIMQGIPAIIEAARAEKGAEAIDIAGDVNMTSIPGFPVDGIPMLVTRERDGSQKAASVLEEVERWRGKYADRPLRRTGTILAHDIETFVAATNRDKRKDSVIFANVPRRVLTAILDFHGPADTSPRFGEDRITYGFQLSTQLDAWIAASSGAMDQKTFSRLVDDRLGDIADEDAPAGSIAAEFARRRGIKLAKPTDLVCFTRTIAAKSMTDSEEVHDDATGNVSIQYKKRNDVKTPDGQPVPVPAAFALMIPVLNGIGATEYIIPVRLRFDIGERGIAWRIELHALDKYVQAAIEEAVAKVREEQDRGGCGLPVYMGSPP
jgi:uncharacterized protein YfdQ (DUF2303 family)